MTIAGREFVVCRLPRWALTAWTPNYRWFVDDISERVYLDIFRLRLIAIRWYGHAWRRPG